MPFVALAKKGRANTESAPLFTQHSKQMHYAYILQSISHPERFYYGSTSNLKKRLTVHNAGGNISTQPFLPWKIAWYGGFPCKQTAIDFERYIKTASGKAFARKRLLYPK